MHVSVQKPGAETGSLLEKVKPGLAALGNRSTYIFLSPGIRNEYSHAAPASLVACNPEWLWCGSAEEKLLKKNLHDGFRVGDTAAFPLRKGSSGSQ